MVLAPPRPSLCLLPGVPWSGRGRCLPQRDVPWPVCVLAQCAAGGRTCLVPAANVAAVAATLRPWQGARHEDTSAVLRGMCGARPRPLSIIAASGAAASQDTGGRNSRGRQDTAGRDSRGRDGRVDHGTIILPISMAILLKNLTNVVFW